MRLATAAHHSGRNTEKQLGLCRTQEQHTEINQNMKKEKYLQNTSLVIHALKVPLRSVCIIIICWFNREGFRNQSRGIRPLGGYPPPSPLPLNGRENLWKGNNGKEGIPHPIADGIKKKKRNKKEERGKRKSEEEEEWGRERERGLACYPFPHISSQILHFLSSRMPGCNN